MKKIAGISIALVAIIGLAGCIAIPVDSGYGAPAPYYGAPAYYSPPVYYGPSVAIGVYGGRGYGHGHRHGHRHYRR
jgi:hypothetical protein